MPELRPEDLPPGITPEMISGLTSSFSWGALIAGFVFGTWGLYLLKKGKREANAIRILIGLALLVYPYFTSSNAALTIAIGLGLCVADRYVRA